MLLLETSNNLKNEKINFFRRHMDFINKYMPDKFKNYIVSFIELGLEECLPLDEKDIFFFANAECDKRLLYAVVYVCYRRLTSRWHNFFDHIRENSLHKLSQVTLPLFFSEQELHQCYRIRQCRPDKNKATYEQLTNISLYNKNQNFSYACYDYEDARAYIQQELGVVVKQAYENLVIPQSQSDFFGVASLFVEGGISVDVCSVAQSNIGILIQDLDILLVFDNIIEKKFIFAKKGNCFIKSYLEFLVEKARYYGADRDYFNFSSSEVFHNYFLDFFAFRYNEIKDLKLKFLQNSIYSAFIRAEGHEEAYFRDASELATSVNIQSSFPTMVVKGLVKKSSLSINIPCKSDYIVHSTDDYYMPSSSNLITVGHNGNTGITLKNHAAYSVASLRVWNLKNVSLSGHACLWKDGHYLSLESYLSSVSENEARSGFWKFPTLNNLTHVIEDPCIVAFSPGYGCYGHYLVDDLPRLALIKDALGYDFYTKKIIISHRTPEWAKNLMRFFLGVKDEQFLVFNHETQIWKLKEVYVASYPNKDYNFHGYIREFYTRFSKRDVKPFRKILFIKKNMDKRKS